MKTTRAFYVAGWIVVWSMFMPMAKADDTPPAAPCCVCGVCTTPTVCFEDLDDEERCGALCEAAGCPGAVRLETLSCGTITECADIRFAPQQTAAPALGVLAAAGAVLAAGLAGILRLLRSRS